jgi:hypothetical protein
VLHLPERLLEQLPQRARLAAAAVRLDEHARDHQAIEIDSSAAAMSR